MDDGPDETEIRARFEAGELRKVGMLRGRPHAILLILAHFQLTNPVLKAFLKHNGERVASNATKDVLVKQVTAWLNNQSEK